MMLFSVVIVSHPLNIQSRPPAAPAPQDYDQFERLLLAAAWTTYNNKRKAAPGPAGGGAGGGEAGGFEEFLGETLDSVSGSAIAVI
jgi:hypothetical protein